MITARTVSRVTTRIATAAALVALAAPAVAQAQAARTTTAMSVSTDDKKPAARAPEVSPEYRLGPGDKIRVEVYKDAQLSQSAQVRPDGMITLPLVGDIEATGRTPIELRESITKSLKEYMTNPVVTVIVVEASAATAYVVGEVAHPGSVNLQAPVTVLQAIAIAGGLKDFASTKNIHIIRKTGSGSQTIAFNYKDAMRGQGPTVYLRPGDTLVVPD